MSDGTLIGNIAETQEIVAQAVAYSRSFDSNANGLLERDEFVAHVEDALGVSLPMLAKHGLR